VFQNDKTLEAYAGTHGQALVDGQPLFLTADGQIPVAAWLWKAVVDQSTGSGIAFVCSNDLSKTAAGPPCGDMDVCVDGDWNDAVVAGWSFCCTLQQLVESIPEAAAAIAEVSDLKLLNRFTLAPPPTSLESSEMSNNDDGDNDEAEEND